MTTGTLLITLGVTIALIGVGMWLAARLTAWVLLGAWAIRRAYQRWYADHAETRAARAWARARRADRGTR